MHEIGLTWAFLGASGEATLLWWNAEWGLLERFVTEDSPGVGDSRKHRWSTSAPHFQPPLTVTRVIAEVAVPGSDDEGSVARALDQAIDHLRFIQQSVALATKGPVRLISRAMLPPLLPVYSGVLHRSLPDDERRLPEV